MSYADLLKAFADPSVTSVTPGVTHGVTKNTQENQSGNPSYPCYPEKPRRSEEKTKQANPDALLLELAQTLQASTKRLRALLSDDDMQDIAEGLHTRAYLLAYFRLMRSDGHQLADDAPEPTKAPENGPRHVDLMKAWKPAHDAMINHLMACPACYAPLSRYCTEGADLRHAYVNACHQHPPTHNPPEVTTL